MANRKNGSPCHKGCGHLTTEHWCKDYQENINTSREIYQCQHCSCNYHIDEAPVPPGYIRVNGQTDYAENAHKYLGSGRRFLGLF